MTTEAQPFLQYESAWGEHRYIRLVRPGYNGRTGHEITVPPFGIDDDGKQCAPVVTASILTPLIRTADEIRAYAAELLAVADVMEQEQVKATATYEAEFGKRASASGL